MVENTRSKAKVVSEVRGWVKKNLEDGEKPNLFDALDELRKIHEKNRDTQFNKDLGRIINEYIEILKKEENKK